MRNRKALKKIAAFGKRKHFPKPLLVFCMAVVLFGYYVCEAFQRRWKGVLAVCMAVFLLWAGIFYGAPYIQKYMNSGKQGEEKYAKANEEQKEEEREQIEEIDTISSVIHNEEEINRILNLLGQKKNTEQKYDSYYIRINRQQNCITIYTKDQDGKYTIPVKAMICSTGGKKTPLGTFTLGKRTEFENLLFEVYGQYAVNIVGQILFHSVSYHAPKKDCLIAEEFNKLGKGVSHGCIRLTVGDAKWVYENCPEGTGVEIYDDKNPGPLGKPEMLKIPEDSSWDPTDDSEDNPWKDCKPEITGVADRDIPLGTEISYLYGVSAKDTCGNNITKDIQVYGEVNVNQKGKYMIVYYVEDLIGRTDLCTAIYTVK